MQHRFFSGINPQKYHQKRAGAKYATRLQTILRRENLSLAGCSSAEPASVLVQREQNFNLISIFTTCQKSQPFTGWPMSIRTLMVYIFKTAHISVYWLVLFL